MDRQRNSNIDLIRIVACMAVVGLHSFPREHSTGTLLAYYLCGFAIPFFFMASGFFLLNRGKIDWNYPFKKAGSILRIVFLWNLVYDSLRSMIKVYSTGQLYIGLLDVLKDTVKCLLQKGNMGHFWYLGALLILYLLLPWISQKSLKYKRCLLFATGAVCFIFQTLSFFVQYPLQAYVIQTFRLWTWLFYFLLGGFIERITFWIKNKMQFKGHLILTIVVTGLVLVVHDIVGTGVILLGGEKPLLAEYYYDCILDMIWVMLLFTLLIRVKLHERIEKPIQKIASLTLGLYIVHYPLRLLMSRVIKVNSFAKAVWFWLIVLTASAGISWLIGKTKIGRYFTKI